MTRAPASTNPASSQGPSAPPAGAAAKASVRVRGARAGAPGARRIVGVHHQGQNVRVVVVTAEPIGGGGPPRPVVVESRTIPIADTAALLAALVAHKQDQIVHVVGSTRTICRCVPVPAGAAPDGASNGVARTRDDLASALALVAEAELPALVPPHRRAAGVIRPGPEGTHEAALVTGWPPRPDDPPRARTAGRNESWTAELAALAALAQSVGGAELVVYADRAAGSVAVIASGRSGPQSNGTGGWRTSARVLRADTSDDQAWRESVTAAVSEARGAAGLVSPPGAAVPVSSEGTVLAIVSGNGSAPAKVPGAPADSTWLRHYGVAYGAACIGAQTDPAARALLDLSAEAPDDRQSLLERSLAWMAVKRHAAALIAACLLAFLVIPLAAAAARDRVLSARAGGAAQLQERLGQAARRAAFYEQLKTRRWPMTKLLADIAAAAPVGLKVDSLDISREQGLSISGKADKAESATLFAKNLRDSAVFGAVGTPTIDTESAGVQFSLEAQVLSPLFPGPRAADFARDPLAVRLYGERARAGGSGAAPAEPTHAASSESPPAETTPASESGRRSGTRPRTPRDESIKAEEAPGRRPASANETPAPITDADIAKMDKNTAMSEWTKRNLASKKADLDAATKQRLTEEAEKCKQRMLELNKSGGGG